MTLPNSDVDQQFIMYFINNSHMGQEPKKTGFPVARDEDDAFSLYIRYYIPKAISLHLKILLFVVEVRLTDSRETPSSSPHKFYSQKVSNSIPEWFGCCFCFYCQSIK